MKKNYLIFQIIFLFFTQFAIANSSIVYIDMDNVMSTSIAGKSILKQLYDINSKASQQFQKTENNFKDQEKKIISQKNILSEIEYEKKIQFLKSEIIEYTKNKKKKINDLNELKKNNTNEFVEQINKILLKYSKDNSISLILLKKNVIIGKSELDISMDIVKLVNAAIKEFKVK
tara:strand:- start:117 stop:638 length:522 start_codon:yes stop_codon:yes gene_type:complete